MFIEVCCHYCKNIFLRNQKEVNRNNKLQRSNFCSIKCRSAFFSKKIDTHCANCQNKIQKSQSEFLASKTGNFFCNRSCRTSFCNRGRVLSEKTKQKISAGRKASLPNTNTKCYDLCVYCNKQYHKTKSNRKFCSTTCYNSNKMKKELNVISNRTWAKIFKRAFPNWKCPYCEWTHTYDVHHINPRVNGIDNSLSNLVLLCPNHHSLITRKIWFPDDLNKYSVDKYYSLEDFSKFYYGGNIWKNN